MIQPNQEQKLVSSTLSYVVLKTVIIFLIPYLIFSMFKGEGIVMFFFIIIGVPAIIYNGLAYNNFTFQLGDDGITIKSGVVSKKTKIIPYLNIQSVDIKAGLLRRMMGIATVNIWTASPNQLHSKNEKSPEGWIMLSANDAETASKLIFSKKQTVVSTNQPN